MSRGSALFLYLFLCELSSVCGPKGAYFMGVAMVLTSRLELNDLENTAKLQRPVGKGLAHQGS